ncbi:MAG TPA: futalosine hydrolase [Phycisphaerales bacterium]|nr:futalosine hydrolase [Phycisphaerales bacterium]
MGQEILKTHGAGKRWLLVVAVPAEARAVRAGLEDTKAGASFEYWAPAPIGDRFELLMSGIGKANAAGAVARVLDPRRYAGVINLGVCGALPSATPLQIGEAIVATESVFADEGSSTPDGFIDLASMGFPPDMGANEPGSQSVVTDARLIETIGAVVTRRGGIATVSVCSGTDAHAGDIARRTGAIGEAMEGAAVGLAALRVAGPAFPFAEVRIVSNTTGDRARQVWDLPRAFQRLRELASAL